MDIRPSPAFLLVSRIAVIIAANVFRSSADEIQPALPPLRTDAAETIYTGDHLAGIDFPVGGIVACGRPLKFQRLDFYFSDLLFSSTEKYLTVR